MVIASSSSPTPPAAVIVAQFECGDGGEVGWGRRRRRQEGAHLPVPVSHQTLLAFKGAVVGILDIVCVTHLGQEPWTRMDRLSEAS